MPSIFKSIRYQEREYSIITPTPWSKIRRHFSNKVVLKLKSAKNAFYKKGALKLIFFNEFFFRKIRMIFDIENSL